MCDCRCVCYVVRTLLTGPAHAYTIHPALRAERRPESGERPETRCFGHEAAALAALAAFLAALAAFLAFFAWSDVARCLVADDGGA